MTTRGRIFFGAGVDEDVMARLERLRACLGESRSHVLNRALVEGGLDALETAYDSDIRTFDRLANGQGMTWREYALAYGQAYARKTYPPTVEELVPVKGVFV